MKVTAALKSEFVAAGVLDAQGAARAGLTQAQAEKLMDEHLTAKGFTEGSLQDRFEAMVASLPST